jgi:hypothetical protein
MDKNEHRRLRILELRKRACGDVTARLAEKIGRTDSYVSRMLYEDGKEGKKRVGIKILNALEEAFNLCPGWFDLPLDTPMMATAVAGSNTHHIAEPTGIVRASTHHIIWPFALTSYGRINALQRALGSKGYGEALRDLDNQLDIVLTKWERMAAEKRTRAKAA